MVEKEKGLDLLDQSTRPNSEKKFNGKGSINQLSAKAFSLFSTISPLNPVPTNIEEVFAATIGVGARGESLKTKSGKLRSLPYNSKEQKQLKKSFPNVTFSGEFTSRGAEHQTSYSGLFPIDIDKDTAKRLNEDMDPLKLLEDLRTDKILNPVFGARSARFQGAYIVCHVPGSNVGNHKERSSTLASYIEKKYGVKVDSSGSDVARTRFLSYDPEAFFNIHGLTDFEKLRSGVECDVAGPRDSMDESAEDWEIPAIVSKLVQSNRDKLRPNDKKPNIESNWNDGIRWTAAGVSMRLSPIIYSDKKELEVKIKNRADLILNAIWANALLNYNGEGFAEAKDAVFSAVNYNTRFRIKKEKEEELSISPKLNKDDKIILNAIHKRGMRFNLMTRQAEFLSGEPVTDRDVNSIVIECRAIKKSIGDAAVHRMIESEHVDAFHPFEEFIKIVEQTPLSIGVINRVLNCIVLDDHSPDYKERIVKKWFGGIMGTLMGSYSVMTLVLVGGQRSGKTTFYRSLLPGSLKRYFAEGELRNDKDCMEVLCTYLLYHDDEYTSANKTEASIRKKLASAENFTIRKPYGRITETRRRTAVLCGSANDQDVISPDSSGNRRVIPTRIKRIDHTKFSRINLLEFYRELLELHKQDPTWWHLSTDDIRFMNEETVQNTVVDPYEERIAMFTAEDPAGHVSTSDVERHIALLDKSFRVNTAKLGRALTNAYGKSTLKKIGGVPVRGYALKLLYRDEFIQKVEEQWSEML